MTNAMPSEIKHPYFQTPCRLSWQAIQAKFTGADWATWQYIQMTDPFGEGKANIDIEVLAEYLSLSTKQIHRSLNKLKEHGFYEWTPQKIRGRNLAPTHIKGIPTEDRFVPTEDKIVQAHNIDRAHDQTIQISSNIEQIISDREEATPAENFSKQPNLEPESGQNTTVALLPEEAEIVEPSEQPSSRAIVPARKNHSQNFAANRIRQTWQETGILPKIPMELDAWAIADIGQEVIFAYRRSGRISTTGRGDIKPEFPAYIASLNPGKDIDYGYTYIKKLEADPRGWETLSSLVLKWQATVKTGDRNLNVVNEVNRKSGPPVVLNL